MYLLLAVAVTVTVRTLEISIHGSPESKNHQDIPWKQQDLRRSMKLKFLIILRQTPLLPVSAKFAIPFLILQEYLDS
ncbi:hypothetical protein F4804DRAFT_304928 [Jackrogersella minutella]|nr:hypothetical protein F4804DRAFT_304928 [Jackrogersella minutella]